MKRAAPLPYIIDDETPDTHVVETLAPHSTAVDPDLPPPWSPKGAPSARTLQIHALRTTLLSIRQQTEGALAQLAALEAGAAVVTADPRMMQRGSIEEQAANVFGKVRAKQQEGA